MILEYASDVDALYVRFRRGKVADTIEIEHLIVVDLDADGQPLGIEFVNADDFLPFLRRHGGPLTWPDDLAAMSAVLLDAEHPGDGRAVGGNHHS